MRLCLLIRSWVAIFLVYIAALAKEQIYGTINWYTVHFCTKWTLYLVLIMLWGAKMQNFRLPKVLALPYSGSGGWGQNCVGSLEIARIPSGVVSIGGRSEQWQIFAVWIGARLGSAL